MDSADYAALQEELAWLDLERRLAAIKPDPRLTCRDCGLSLPDYRRAHGLCLGCAERAERRIGRR